MVQTLDNTCYLTDYGLRIKKTIRLDDNRYVVVVKEKIYQVNSVGQVDLLDDELKPVRKNIFPEITSRITQIIGYRDQFLIGTFGQGLFVYNAWGKLLRRLDKKNGLQTNIVTSLLVDGNQLYIGSNLGLMKAGLPELRNTKMFTENEGMFNWECRTDGLLKLSNGGILISTTNGPYLYHPAKDPAQQTASAVLTVADIRYGENGDGQPAFSPYNRQIHLSKTIDYKNRNITITLSGVSQRNPDGIQYHYQLGGYDSMWVTTADPVLVFNDLSPGDYRLRAYLSVGSFQSKPMLLTFSIGKPLSGQLWFQLLLVLFLSLLCWVLLTIGNRIYQKYIQTRMVGKLNQTWR